MKHRLTGCLNPGPAAHHQAEGVLGNTLVVALIRRAIRLGLLEMADEERAIDDGGALVVLRQQQAVAPPLHGDGRDAVHLAMEHERLLLHGDDVAGLKGEGELGLAHHTWGDGEQETHVLVF